MIIGYWRADRYPGKYGRHEKSHSPGIGTVAMCCGWAVAQAQKL